MFAGNRDEAIKAHLVQIGALSVFNANIEISSNGKKLPDNIRHFFEFINVYLWDIKVQAISESTGALSKKRVAVKVKDLWTKMNE